MRRSQGCYRGCDSSLLIQAPRAAVPQKAPSVALSHAREKFYLATLGLAIGEGAINERLENAAIGLSGIRPDSELPEDVVPDFEQLLRELTTCPAEIEGEGTIHATVRQLDPYDARNLAERIFEMYFRVLGVRPL